MELEIYFFSQVYETSSYRQKQHMDFLISESMDPYTQHFSLNAQGTSTNYFRFLRKMELQLHLALIGKGYVLLIYKVTNGQEWEGGWEWVSSS